MTAERRLHAVVTGGGSGIGAAAVAVLAREGWRVAVLDRDGAAAHRVAQAAGADHLDVAVDVSDEKAVAAAFAAVAKTFGRIDGLATCAGIIDTTPFLDIDADTFRRLYDVNVVGTFLCIREAAGAMPSGAAICTLSSIAGLRGGGLVGTAAYAATKGALLALTKTAARSLADRGIRVNCVAPGPTLTPMLSPHFSDTSRMRIESTIPLGRVGTSEEIAEALAWLLSPRASYINGATLVADGGMVML
jgi:NAD(P)-dependent dehydrogenase (short-subunit alcohol dehydrogenase family)